MARITEKKRITIDTCVPDNPFYICWLNKLGGWDFWLFGVNQVYGQNVGDVVSYIPNYTDISSADATTKTLRKSSTPSVVLFESFATTDEIKALEAIQESPSVYWYKDPSRNIWQQIRPKPGSRTSYETEDSLHEFSMTFDLQDRFLQGN